MEPALHDVKAFLKQYLEGKGTSQARIALWHWENFTEQKPSEVDQRVIDKFIYEFKKRLKPNSLIVYLFHIGEYLAWSGKKDLKKYIMERRKKLKAEDTTEHLDHHDVLKMLMEVEELLGKLLVRLLLFSEIPIGCLEELRVRHIHGGKNYDMYCERAHKWISGTFYSDTSDIIDQYIEGKNEDEEVIGIKQREIQYLITDYAKKVEIDKKVTPKDLRKIGKDKFKRDWLIEEYEKNKSLRVKV